MYFHALLHSLRIVAIEAFRSDIQTQVTAALGLTMALALFVVGVYRWREFLDYGFSTVRRRGLIILHIAGCFVFCIALALLSIDVNKKIAGLTMGLLFSGLIFLFPIQIYLGILRRLRGR
jgi:hypothetical protein